MSNEIIIGAIFFILGLIPAYYFYVKSLRNKEPVYSIKSNNIVDDFKGKYRDLRVIFKEREIRTLTVSKILLYNRGAETITKDDIDTSNHLQVKVRFFDADRFDLLDVSVLQTNCDANQFKITLGGLDYQAIIDFDYLDKNQGAVIQVFHTGITSNDIDVVGDIRGVEKLTQISSDNLVKTVSMKTSDKIFFIVALIVSAIGDYLLIFQGEFVSTIFKFYNWLFSLLFIGVFVFSFLVTIIFLAILIERIRREIVRTNTIPKGLEKFAE